MNRWMPIATLALLTAPLLAGCFGAQDDLHGDCWRDRDPETQDRTGIDPAAIDLDANQETPYIDMGFDGQNWPDLSGEELTILDHGAFDFAFGEAKPLFENLTGAVVKQVAADDTGTALQQAVQEKQQGGGAFDVLYGIDNAYMQRAVDEELFKPYTPLLAERVAEAYRFVPLVDGAWVATPVDHGYIAVNSDPRSVPDEELQELDDLVDRADRFVTMDPRTSSPGMGFLLATVATYGEDCYLGYWEELFDNGVTITSGWTEGYVDRFSGGYGQFEQGTLGDKPIVTSYTTSPAYEVYFENPVLNDVLLAPESAFHQIQTMGILSGTENLAAAQAWIEFTLTDDFQNLAAPMNAIYPVVETDATGQVVRDVYAGDDPRPGSFVPAQLDAQEMADLDQWVEDWVDLYTRKQA